jgi:hypothetical protein
MAMPLVGLDVTPTIPTMRELTVTKKKANMTTSSAATARPRVISMLLKACGASVRRRKMARAPIPTTLSGRSFCVRSTSRHPAASRSRSWRVPIRKLSIMVGTLRISVTSPPVATAPAPM